MGRQVSKEDTKKSLRGLQDRFRRKLNNPGYYDFSSQWMQLFYDLDLMEFVQLVEPPAGADPNEPSDTIWMIPNPSLKHLH